MSRSCDVILDSRVSKVLHVVVMTTEVSSDAILLQQRLQVLHQDLCGTMFGNRPHCTSKSYNNNNSTYFFVDIVPNQCYRSMHYMFYALTLYTPFLLIIIMLI